MNNMFLHHGIWNLFRICIKLHFGLPNYKLAHRFTSQIFGCTLLQAFSKRFILPRKSSCADSVTYLQFFVYETTVTIGIGFVRPVQKRNEMLESVGIYGYWWIQCSTCDTCLCQADKMSHVSQMSAIYFSNLKQVVVFMHIARFPFI